jgi:hypothetical protein
MITEKGGLAFYVRREKLAGGSGAGAAFLVPDPGSCRIVGEGLGGGGGVDKFVVCNSVCNLPFNGKFERELHFNLYRYFTWLFVRHLDPPALYSGAAAASLRQDVGRPRWL